MNQRDLANARVLELTLDEEWILSARIMASEARGPMRRGSLEEIVAARDEWARLNRRRRLIQFVIVLTVFLFLA